MVETSHNKNLQRLSKAQAREQFTTLIEALSTTGGVVEVTDCGKVAAVILSYKDYLWLVAHSREPLKPKRQLAGSAVLFGDLGKANHEITENILGSTKNSAREL